ncbi:hypothetical protein L873DRAFT_1803233 [Choiromyces venosus 120613-1]|uniref:Uncharacterized protein n=1 Tax=Choiromyces venosus 120613-1 TaxID=1336337 RepID=A0A3N4JXH7_9PEZI|nr:hypothetical protein L873DRAFT_1803233 [Choiromyces venosus 120613-1]
MSQPLVEHRIRLSNCPGISHCRTTTALGRRIFLLLVVSHTAISAKKERKKTFQF